jgi:hypothetical protein
VAYIFLLAGSLARSQSTPSGNEIEVVPLGSSKNWWVGQPDPNNPSTVEFILPIWYRVSNAQMRGGSTLRLFCDPNVGVELQFITSPNEEELISRFINSRSAPNSRYCFNCIGNLEKLKTQNLFTTNAISRPNSTKQALYPFFVRSNNAPAVLNEIRDDQISISFLNYFPNSASSSPIRGGVNFDIRPIIGRDGDAHFERNGMRRISVDVMKQQCLNKIRAP